MRKLSYILAAVAASALSLMTLATLSGCNQYQRFASPDMTFADSLYHHINVHEFATDNDSICIGAMHWTDLFQDTLLQKLIFEGLRSNTDLNIARLKVKEAQSVLETSKMAFLPSLNASLSDNAKSNTKFSNNFSVSLDASWEVDAFGRLANALRSSEMDYAAQDAYRQAVETSLVASIAEHYFTLLMLDEQLSISQRTLKNWEENIRALNALKSAGKANQASVLRARANRMTVEANVQTLQRQIKQQENTLCQLLGQPCDCVERDSLSHQVFPSELSVGVPMQLLSRRPDIKRAEYNLASAFYTTNYARADLYPRLTLGGTLGWTDNAGKAVSNPGGLLLSLIGNVVQPLFDRGRIKSNIEISELRQQEALLTFRQTVYDAGVEVNNALVQWQTARERIGIDKRRTVTLRAAVWNTRLLMRYGRATYLEVLTAQQDLLSSELQTATDCFDQIQGVIRLYHALGGGL